MLTVNTNAKALAFKERLKSNVTGIINALLSYDIIWVNFHISEKELFPMKKTLAIGVATLLGSAALTMSWADKDVYICKGPKSKRYHLVKDCKGLKNCSTDIYKVTFSEAKKLDRTLCGWED